MRVRNIDLIHTSEVGYYRGIVTSNIRVPYAIIIGSVFIYTRLVILYLLAFAHQYQSVLLILTALGQREIAWSLTQSQHFAKHFPTSR